MNYKKAVKYLDSFVDYEKIGYITREPFKLDRMRSLAKLFGNPEESFPAIHVAGTKGKGSTSAFIAGILKEAGYKTGLYTSPHIEISRERIKIDDRMISESDFAFYAGEIKKTLEGRELAFQPTFFEIYTILTFNYFKDKKIDFGVIEVGLGGRLDATNIVRPLVSVITPISYDHTHILGRTLEKIAFEKSGIIKSGCVTISAPQEREVLKVIQEKCESLGVELIEVGKDINFKELYHDDEKEIFNIKGTMRDYSSCEIRLLGVHQVLNATSAAAVAETLNKKGIKLTKTAVKEGMRKTKNPGRCEIIARNPYIVTDGAQNKASANALKKTLKRNFSYKRLILVLGISKEKDIGGLCEELIPLADEIILTKAKIERAENPHKIARFIRKKEIIFADSVTESLKLALLFAKKEDMILITGSFFLIQEAREVAFAEEKNRV